MPRDLEEMKDCFGCFMFQTCNMKYDLPKQCPCQKCLIKNICKEACKKYSLAYQCWSDLQNYNIGK